MDKSSRSLSETYKKELATPSDKLTVGVSVAVAIAVILSAFAFVVAFQPQNPSDIQSPNPDEPYASNITDYDSLYNQTHTSVVSVYVTKNGTASSQGSGFLHKGNIVTNKHVVSGGERFYIQYANGEWDKAELLGADSYTDLAVLSPRNDSPEYVDPLPVRTELPDRGDKVAVIGSPTGLRGSITTGVVSGTGRTLQTESNFAIPDMIQTDSPLNPGNSGGPLINTDGEVIGVVNAKKGENIGYAISARLMDKVVQSLADTGNHKHPYLGVRTIDLSPRLSEANNLSTTRGILVVGTSSQTNAPGAFESSNSTTEMYGQEFPVNGDVIIAVEGEPIADGGELGSYLIRNNAPSDIITMTVIRDGNKQTVQVQLVNRP
jgi:S1-C subfamily serine protease